MRSGDGVVQVAVHCRRCGYNLYGLPADGSCPECGLPAWETILHTVDPAASRLPRLRNPAVVGNALLWLMLCLAAAALLLVVRPVALWIDAMEGSGLRRAASAVPRQLPIVAGLIGLAAVWWARRLAPPLGEEPGGSVWRSVRLLAGGLAAWGVLLIAVGAMDAAGAPATAGGIVWLGVAGAGVVALVGLRGILRIIGLRSREYRTAQVGRQGVAAMIAAIAGAALGQALRLAAGPAGMQELATLGVVISVISTLMVEIGLLYLVANAVWIRRALRCPPPRLNEIVGRQ